LQPYLLQYITPWLTLMWRDYNSDDIEEWPRSGRGNIHRQDASISPGIPRGSSAAQQWKDF
jgi:hypothetical protein